MPTITGKQQMHKYSLQSLEEGKMMTRWYQINLAEIKVCLNNNNFWTDPPPNLIFRVEMGWGTGHFAERGPKYP